MGANSSACSQVHHLEVTSHGSRRVMLRWEKPLLKGKGNGRAHFYRIETAVDTFTRDAYAAALHAWVPPAGNHSNPRAREEAAELAAGAVVHAPNWVILNDAADNPLHLFVRHVRGQKDYSREIVGLTNNVKYKFTVVVETIGMGDAPGPLIVVACAPCVSTPTTFLARQ